MQKKSLLALLLALMMIMSGCALVTVDEKKDNARVIVDVNGETVDKQTVNSAVQNAISQYEYYNQLYAALYGVSDYFPTDEATIREQVIQSYVNNLVSKQKAYAEGFGEMTEEETAAIEETAQSNYDSFIQQVISNYFAGSELEGDELTAAAEQYIADHGMVDKAYFVQAATDDKAIEKLQADVIKDVEVTEEDLQAAFDEKVAEEKAEMEESPDEYGYHLLNGAAVYYAPAGYRMVKHILVAVDENDAAVTEATAALTEAQNALSAAEEGADTTELQAAVDAAQAALDAANEQAKANAKAKADEVYALATAEGADFDALIAEYSTDSMPAEGYAVREGYAYFMEEFVAGAMALENVGDVSEPVETTYGYHIIQYVSDVAEGPVDIETVRETLSADALSDKQTKAQSDALAAWTEAANVKTYPERMK